MHSSADDRRYIPTLDLVRFWAAMAVASYHLAFWSWASPADLPFRASGGSVRFEDLEPFTWFGWVGVETFFVISGLVICASAERATAYQFLRGRIARLYPAIWICASVTATTLLIFDITPGRDLFPAYLRSIAIVPWGPWVDTVYRTLGVEIVFYGFVFVILLFRGFRRIEPIAIGLGASSLAFWLASPFVDVRTLAPGAILNFAKYGIFFALGMMIWIVTARGPSWWRLAVIAILICGGAAEVDLVAVGMHAYASREPAFVAVVVWLSSVAAIILGAAPADGVARRIGLPTHTLRTLGLMTYPLYLLHDVVGSVVLRLASRVGQRPALALAVCVVLGAAYLVVRLEPAIRRQLMIVVDGVGMFLRRGTPAASVSPPRPPEQSDAASLTRATPVPLPCVSP